MFDIGWTELLLIGIVALIVVGPKDLPGMFRALGKFTARMRSMAREFQRSMDEAADQSGMRDVARDLRKMTSTREMGLDAVKKAAVLDDDDTQGAADRPGTKQKTPGEAGVTSLSAEREEARRKIAERTAAAAQARHEAEAQAAAPETAPETVPAPDGEPR